MYDKKHSFAYKDTLHFRHIKLHFYGTLRDVDVRNLSPSGPVCRNVQTCGFVSID